MNAKPRNPLLAAVLSLLIPGLGQLYSGRLARALAIAVIGSVLLILLGLTIQSGNVMTVLGYQTLAGTIFSIAVTVDAWRVAGRAGSEYVPDERNRTSTYIGFTLLVLLSSALVALLEARRMQDHLRTFRIVGKSNYPTLHDGDILSVDYKPYLETDPETGELVIFRSPENRQQHWTSRIVATGGQTVEIRNGKLLIDGETLHTNPETEVHGNFTVTTAGMDEVADFGPVTVPEYDVFLLSDNRKESVDSRAFGPVSVAAIEGRLKHRYFPRARMGPLNETSRD